MKSESANLTVFATSALILVLEIVAGRLMAPYVGVSLETFTAIIGTVLAGIAGGSAAGGWAADRQDPRQLLGPMLVLGGVLSWLSLPIVTFIGPRLANNVPSIVFLTAAAFLAPAAVLSTISPMVAKLRLGSLDDTGSVVGGLSAAGTFGALVGTFVTGFILVALLPSRTIVMAVGFIAVAAGIFMWWRLRREAPPAAALGLVLVAGIFSPALQSPCQRETEYFCVRVEVDPERPSGRSLFLDRLRHAYIDLDDPTFIDIRYIRLFSQVSAALPEGPIDAVHIGGGGFTYPRYLEHVRPGSTNLVFEIDGELVEVAEEELGLDSSSGIDITIGDARLALDDLETNSADLIVGDVFGSESVPWHLTTREVMQEIRRVLRPDGIYMMNVIDGTNSRYARAQLATLRAEFEHLGLVLPENGVPINQRVNQLLLASEVPLPELNIVPEDGELFLGDEVEEYIGDADILTDAFAPVDQLIA